MSFTDTQPTTLPKRRACDECRTRKLACSKEQEGCARCIRENLRCNYSEQKPMGRPRKKHSAYSAKEINLSPLIPDFDDLPYIDDYPIGLYSDSNNEPDSDYSMAPLSLSFNESLDIKQRANPSYRQPEWLFGADLFELPIDFGAGKRNLEDLLHPLPDPLDLSTVDIDQVRDTLSPVPRPLRNTLSSVSRRPCNCLETISLAMSSLFQLPSDVEAALIAVRNAARTAYAVLRCGNCGGCKTTDPESLIAEFQNTMLMNTILPATANGYGRLLPMIDEEAKMAQDAGRNKNFRLSDYGDLIDGVSACSEAEHLQNAELKPMEWRLIMRALLRADIYGVLDISGGLNNIISELEQRQLNRQAMFDQLTGSGYTTSDAQIRQYLSEKEFCVRLLDTSKQALGALVIP